MFEILISLLILFFSFIFICVLDCSIAIYKHGWEHFFPDDPPPMLMVDKRTNTWIIKHQKTKEDVRNGF